MGGKGDASWGVWRVALLYTTPQRPGCASSALNNRERSLFKVDSGAVEQPTALGEVRRREHGRPVLTARFPVPQLTIPRSRILPPSHRPLHASSTSTAHLDASTLHSPTRGPSFQTPPLRPRNSRGPARPLAPPTPLHSLGHPSLTIPHLSPPEQCQPLPGPSGNLLRHDVHPGGLGRLLGDWNTGQPSGPAPEIRRRVRAPLTTLLDVIDLCESRGEPERRVLVAEEAVRPAIQVRRWPRLSPKQDRPVNFWVKRLYGIHALPDTAAHAMICGDASACSSTPTEVKGCGNCK
jgi:hypothetical protein